MNPNPRVPVSFDMFYVCKAVASRTMRRGQGFARYWLHEPHPEWDCQPWSEGMSFPYGPDVVYRYSSEVYTNLEACPQLLRAAQHYLHPYVFRL